MIETKQVLNRFDLVSCLNEGVTMAKKKTLQMYVHTSEYSSFFIVYTIFLKFLRERFFF